MNTKSRLAGPGIVLNRHAKRGRFEIAFDPSPEAFITEARKANERVKVLIVADGMDPIEISAQSRAWVMKFEASAVPSGRLADLEALITEEQNVHIVLEYEPKQDALPFNVDQPATSDPAPAATERARHYAFALKLLKKLAASCKVVLTETAGGWEGWVDIAIPHAETRLSLAAELGEAVDSREGLLDSLLNALVAWLREQTAYDRRDQLERAVRKQLAEWQKENP